VKSDNTPTPLPDAIHIVVVVYGKVYATLLAEITLANLAAMVREIPGDLRGKSVVRILTTAQDIGIIERSGALPALRAAMPVQITDELDMDGLDKHGKYGPMVATQRRAVRDAARANAAIFFVGPDQIYSRGAFAMFVERLRQGFRVVVGPGTRIGRDKARQYLLDQIAGSRDGSFALAPNQQIDLFFRFWHPINDQYVMGSEKDIWWKAYVYYRPHPDELFIRFFQGPTFVAWPLRRLDEFEGFIDHSLILACCNDPGEAYVVPDANECLALDMTEDARMDPLPLAEFPRVDLLRQFFDHGAINEMQLLHGLRTCRVHRGDRLERDVNRWKRELARAVDPVIVLALAERRVVRRLGSLFGSMYRALTILGVNTACLLIDCLFLRFFVRRHGLNAVLTRKD
jgi:hypothetical protein